MPIYPFECSTCNKSEDVYATVSDYERGVAPMCCRAPMDRIYTPLHVQPDISGYQSQITGEWIGSRSRHRDHLRQHDCVEVGDQMPTRRTPPDDKTIVRDVVEAYKRVTGDL